MSEENSGCIMCINSKGLVSHNLSHCLACPSYFQDPHGDLRYCTSRGTVCLQDLPQKQQYVESYYSPYTFLKPDPVGKVSSSSYIKSKQVDYRECEQQC